MSDTRDAVLYIILFCTVVSYFVGCGNRAQIDRIEKQLDGIKQDIGDTSPSKIEVF